MKDRSLDSVYLPLKIAFGIVPLVAGLDKFTHFISHRRTADCLDSVANTKVRLHRARALLQSRIDRRLGAVVRKLHQFAGERCDRIVAGVLNRIA